MSSSAPSTATVLEFRCLFTHDLRRKQKRWQDGRLKYHSFNSRVMVYDERGNSVGDMHWHGEYDFGEGEEVQLDRGGVIVQVEDLVERRETDLTELVDKRIQEKQQRHMQQLARSAASGAVLPRPLPRPPSIAPDRVQPLRRQPLHRIIGTPTGHHGKALAPRESPYEQRQQAPESPDDRATKRRKYDGPPPRKSGYATALFGQTLTLSATPSSSIRAIPRARPEAPSNPPVESDSQDTREDPEPQRREKLQPSRRSNQSGYAQSLFGQALTLSHTPVNSVAARSQPRTAPASSPMVDSDRKTPREEADTVQIQKSLGTHHPCPPGSKSVSTLPNTRGKPGHGQEDGGANNVVSKKNDSMSQAKRAKDTIRGIPDNVDIIEIDDTEPDAFRPVRQPKAHETTAAGLSSRNDNSDTSVVSMGQHYLSHENTGPSTVQHKLDSNGHGPKMVKGHERTRKPDSAASKANVKSASSRRTGPASHEMATHLAVTPRDPEFPVTELRIKSSKKRGLLMISDTSKVEKARRKVATDSSRSFERSLAHHSRDSEDDPFQSPSPRSASKFGNGCNAGAAENATTTVYGGDNGNRLDSPVLNQDLELDEADATSVPGKKYAQRTVSAELGEVDDVFRSRPPAISKETHSKPKPARTGRDMQSKGAGHEQLETSAQNTSATGLSGGSHCGPVPVKTSPLTKRLSSTSRTGYDPYRMPSSPHASNPETSSSSKRKRHGNDFGDEILKPIDNNKIPSKAKKRRPGRRTVLSDDDDDEDSEQLVSLPKIIDYGSGSENMTASKLAGDAPKKQPYSRQATRSNIRVQEAVSVVESGDERPKRAARKSRGQQKEIGEVSDEDRQPIKRRQSTRQGRSRATSYKEPVPLPGEDGDSEEEEIPTKRRRTKMSKASEDRPRLERIKKNVKSRELVGFNLAALNAPLGLRGIGMPFSILPSSVDASIQRHSSTHSAMDESLGGKINEGDDDDQASPPSPNPPAAPFKTNAEAQREITASKPTKGSPYHAILADYENLETEASARPLLPSPNQPVREKSSTSHKKFTHGMSEDTRTEVPPETMANFQTSPEPLPAPTKTPSNLMGASLQDRLHANDQPPSNTGPAIVNKADVSAGKTVVTEKIAVNLVADYAPKPQVATSPNQQKPGIQGGHSALGPPRAPDTVATDRPVPAGPSTVSFTVQKSTPVLNPQSSSTGDPNASAEENAADNPDSESTPDLPVRQSKAIGLRRQVPAPRRINNIAAKSVPQTETTESSSADVQRKPPSHGLLANPASRGRKAALASHAAGQVPQRILPPTQPALMIPISTADLAMTPIDEAPKESERPKKKMTFPGFQSARNDGPWSREAFDLLESGRPE